MNRWMFRVGGVMLLTAGAGTAAAQTTGGNARAAGLSPATRQQLTQGLDRAAEYLRQQQGADGIWEKHPGITAMAATALLRQPGTKPEAQMAVAGKSLDALAKLAKPDGGIYEKMIPHYITAVSVMSFVAGGRPQDKPLIEKGRRYLAEHLLDEGEGIPPSDKFYGGMGYGGTSNGGIRRHVSLESGLRRDERGRPPASIRRGRRRSSSSSALRTTARPTTRSGATDDGGFVYTRLQPGARPRQSYGSATYAGIRSYTWANLKKTDPRTQSALSGSATTTHPRQNPGLGQKTLVLLLHGVREGAPWPRAETTIVDAKGGKHNWREELARKLSASTGRRLLVEHGQSGDAGQQGPGHRVTMMAADAILQ